LLQRSGSPPSSSRVQTCTERATLTIMFRSPFVPQATPLPFRHREE
jgi:hypothetical protein